jgi:hypothetical protein
MNTQTIDYREQLENISKSVCQDITKELQRIGKEELRQDEGLDEFKAINDENNIIVGINKDGEVLIESFGGDEFELSIYSEDWNIYDLIYILEMLKIIK